MVAYCFNPELCTTLVHGSTDLPLDVLVVQFATLDMFYAYGLWGQVLASHGSSTCIEQEICLAPRLLVAIGASE